MLQIDSLNFSIGEKKILHDVTLQFDACKIHGIIGPNGSGKSTLLKNICRIWEPQSGRVFVNDQDYKSISRKDLSRLITLVPQNTNIGFPVSVYDIVSMGRHPHLGRFQSLTRQDKKNIEKALKVTQTYELKDRNINELSGGECQLAIIARALVTEASLILLDEPTSDLDIKHALIIMDLIGDLKEEGKTIMACIHDLNLARRYCDTISIINEGKIFYTGPSAEAFSKQNIHEAFDVRMHEITDNSKSFLYFYK